MDYSSNPIIDVYTVYSNLKYELSKESKGIRQWMINACKTQMMVHKIAHFKIKIIGGKVLTLLVSTTKSRFFKSFRSFNTNECENV